MNTLDCWAPGNIHRSYDYWKQSCIDYYSMCYYIMCVRVFVSVNNIYVIILIFIYLNVHVIIYIYIYNNNNNNNNNNNTVFI